MSFYRRYTFLIPILLGAQLLVVSPTAVNAIQCFDLGRDAASEVERRSDFDPLMPTDREIREKVSSLKEEGFRLLNTAADVLDAVYKEVSDERANELLKQVGMILHSAAGAFSESEKISYPAGAKGSGSSVKGPGINKDNVGLYDRVFSGEKKVPDAFKPFRRFVTPTSEFQILRTLNIVQVLVNHGVWRPTPAELNHFVLLFMRSASQMIFSRASVDLVTIERYAKNLIAFVYGMQPRFVLEEARRVVNTSYPRMQSSSTLLGLLYLALGNIELQTPLHLRPELTSLFLEVLKSQELAESFEPDTERHFYAQILEQGFDFAVDPYRFAFPSGNQGKSSDRFKADSGGDGFVGRGYYTRENTKPAMIIAALRRLKKLDRNLFRSFVFKKAKELRTASWSQPNNTFFLTRVVDYIVGELAIELTVQNLDSTALDFIVNEFLDEVPHKPNLFSVLRTHPRLKTLEAALDIFLHVIENHSKNEWVLDATTDSMPQSDPQLVSSGDGRSSVRSSEGEQAEPVLPKRITFEFLRRIYLRSSHFVHKMYDRDLTIDGYDFISGMLLQVVAGELTPGIFTKLLPKVRRIDEAFILDPRLYYPVDGNRVIESQVMALAVATKSQPVIVAVANLGPRYVESLSYKWRFVPDLSAVGGFVALGNIRALMFKVFFTDGHGRTGTITPFDGFEWEMSLSEFLHLIAKGRLKFTHFSQQEAADIIKTLNIKDPNRGFLR